MPRGNTHGSTNSLTATFTICSLNFIGLGRLNLCVKPLAHRSQLLHRNKLQTLKFVHTIRELQCCSATRKTDSIQRHTMRKYAHTKLIIFIHRFNSLVQNEKRQKKNEKNNRKEMKGKKKQSERNQTSTQPKRTNNKIQNENNCNFLPFLFCMSSMAYIEDWMPTCLCLCDTSYAATRRRRWERKEKRRIASLIFLHETNKWFE